MVREVPELHKGDLLVRMHQSRARELRLLLQEGSTGGLESEEELLQGFDFDFLTGTLQGSQRVPGFREIGTPY